MDLLTASSNELSAMIEQVVLEGGLDAPKETERQDQTPFSDAVDEVVVIGKDGSNIVFPCTDCY